MTLSEMQLDALREVGNIGVSHSATALSDIIGERIDMSVPGIRIVPMEVFGSEIDGDPEGMNLILLLKGDIRCAMLLHFSGMTRKSLSAHLVLGTKEYPEAVDAETLDMMDSAIKEVANILVSQTADAFSTLLDMRMEPSTPYVIDPGTHWISAHMDALEVNPDAILLDAMLTSDGLAVATKIFIIPFKSSVGPILERLGVADL